MIPLWSLLFSLDFVIWCNKRVYPDGSNGLNGSEAWWYEHTRTPLFRHYCKLKIGISMSYGGVIRDEADGMGIQERLLGASWKAAELYLNGLQWHDQGYCWWYEHTVTSLCWRYRKLSNGIPVAHRTNIEKIADGMSIQEHRFWSIIQRCRTVSQRCLNG